MYSREEPVKELLNDDGRIQYDEADPDRIQEAAKNVSQSLISLINKMGDYRDAITEETTEDTPSRIALARREVVEYWAATQFALSAVAWCFRVDGKDAYERFVHAMKHEDVVDMRGL